MQGAWLHQEVHRPELAEEARQDSARGRVLRQQEAQGDGPRPGGREEVGRGHWVLSAHDTHDSKQQRERITQD